ncbi:MAG: hypothetical protein U0796_22160 [Gemmatales bacterium]
MTTPADVLTNLLERIVEKYGQKMPDIDEQVDSAELRSLIDETLTRLNDGYDSINS